MDNAQIHYNAVGLYSIYAAPTQVQQQAAAAAANAWRQLLRRPICYICVGTSMIESRIFIVGLLAPIDFWRHWLVYDMPTTHSLSRS